MDDRDNRSTPSLTPEQYQRLSDLVEQAAGLPAADRRSFLLAACGPDSALQGEALALLDAQNTLAAADGILAPGTRVGPYSIDGPIGRGGMGAVYLASRADGTFDKRVAIKVIRPDIDSHEIVARFKLERQILASFEHPNIGRLIDAGALDDGQPYFVMEYIEGVPITTYADRASLSVRDRTVLFRRVCDAVVHAHQRHVVHRDIKPSNILVTSNGTPKLLDFGIARLLDGGGRSTVQLTATNLNPGTPLYASPEQRAGELVDARTDVYALGVVLFELLVGWWPFVPVHDGTGAVPTKPSDVVAEMSPQAMAAARGVTAERLRRQLQGDLDAIVAFALREDVRERYQSVAALNADLDRHLAHLPVLARHDSFWYRTTCFATRHRKTVTAAALGIVAAGAISAAMSLLGTDPVNGSTTDLRPVTERRDASIVSAAPNDGAQPQPTVPAASPSLRGSNTPGARVLSDSRPPVASSSDPVIATDRSGSITHAEPSASAASLEAPFKSVERAEPTPPQSSPPRTTTSADDGRIREVLRELEQAINQQNTVQVRNLYQRLPPDALAAIDAQIVGAEAYHVEIRNVRVQVNRANTDLAQAACVVARTVTPLGGQTRDITRQVIFAFGRVADGWQILDIQGW